MRKRYILLVLFVFFSVSHVYAFQASDYKNKKLCGTFEVAGFHSDGVLDPVYCTSSFSSAKEWMKNNGARDLGILTKVNGQSKIVDANVGLLDLSVNPDTLTYFYSNSDLLGSSYTYMDTGSLYGGVDGALIDSSYSNNRGVYTAKVRIGNYTGWIESKAYEIVPITWVKSESSYTVTSDSIKHNYVSKIQNSYNGSKGSIIGPKPNMLSVGKYYSYDGHYFYNNLETLLRDYKNNTYNNSVNKNAPYYNYYMYLSNHTKTTYSSININEYIRNNLGIKEDAYGKYPSGGSRLYGSGTFFYYAQQKYGVNAVLSLSLSRNETGNGKSLLAIDNNNGFGLNAVDRNPTKSANWYATFPSSILGYASKWITDGYAYPKDWRYFGPQFGDKMIGMNVKYASDTYWSEKMAANYYALDRAFGLQDYNYYQLGVVTGPTNAYSSPSVNSRVVYQYPEAEDGLVITKEENINNEKWYKVVSDLNIDSNYNYTKRKDYNWNGEVYVRAAQVKKINDGKNSYISPNSVTDYQDSDYTYDLLIENNEKRPRVGVSTSNTNYYYDSSLTSKNGSTLLKDKYVIIDTIAYKNDRVVSYLVTSDYFHDQKHWVKASEIKQVNTSVGKVSVTTKNNEYTWVNYNTVDAKYSLISGLYTNTYVPVLDKVDAGGSTWYKVPVDLTSNKNSYGYTLASAPDVSVTLSTPIVDTYPPVIKATDKELNVGDKFNVMDGVSASDQDGNDITDKVKVIENTVDINKEGSYKVVYRVTDKNGKSSDKSIVVTVKKGNTPPVIKATDKELNVGDKFNVMDGVSASDQDGNDITDKVKVVENTVDINKEGSYKVIYRVTDKNGKSSDKSIVVTVKKGNTPPVIKATDKELNVGDKFNVMDGVSAYDQDGDDITDKVKVIENTVDINKEGSYKVIYRVTDKNGKSSDKSIIVKVMEKSNDNELDLDKLDKEDAIFYLDYMKVVGGSLEVKGYSTINGIDNDLDTDINYYIEYYNIDTKKTIIDKAIRITKKSEITRPVFGLDDKDYTYSWFKYDFNFKDIPNGNYLLYVIATDGEKYSISTIRNPLNKTQVTSYSKDKEVLTRNNYNYKESPIELIVRSDRLARKTAGSYYNQYDTVRVLEFNNNKLHLKGITYSYGMDLSKSRNITRRIIFEDQDNYKTYSYDLDYSLDGLYRAVLPVDDNLSKDKAWYDKSIDISGIPRGTYTIYITTSSNITDISEVTNNLNKDLSNIRQTINNKQYSFNTNFKNNSKIELVVK